MISIVLFLDVPGVLTASPSSLLWKCSQTRWTDLLLPIADNKRRRDIEEMFGAVENQDPEEVRLCPGHGPLACQEVAMANFILTSKSGCLAARVV